MTNTITTMVAQGMTATQIASVIGKHSSAVRMYLGKYHVPYARFTRGQAQHVPVQCRGITYASQAECARALGVRNSTVFYALERGTIDRCGLRGSVK